jgi:hypothetical protein
MWKFDSFINKKIKEVGGIYRRYSDDILIVCNNAVADKVQEYVLQGLKELSLEINHSKTDIKKFKRDNAGILRCFDRDGNPSRLQYLGIEFDGVNYFLRGSSIARYYRKMSKAVRATVRRAQSKNKVVPRKNLYI